MKGMLEIGQDAVAAKHKLEMRRLALEHTPAEPPQAANSQTGRPRVKAAAVSRHEAPAPTPQAEPAGAALSAAPRGQEGLDRPEATTGNVLQPSMLLPLEQGQALAPGGCGTLPVQPQADSLPLPQLVEEALAILQAPGVRGVEGAPRWGYHGAWLKACAAPGTPKEQLQQALLACVPFGALPWCHPALSVSRVGCPHQCGNPAVRRVWLRC